MSHDLVLSLQRQNRLLRKGLGLAALSLAGILLVAAKGSATRFAELEVEKLTIVTAEGKRELVLANRDRLPGPVINGKEGPNDRRMPGLVFYNEAGDECGGLIWKGKLDAHGKPASGMHFSMDRFGGDQQLALGHYEQGGIMDTGLNVYDRGLQQEYGPLWEAMEKAPKGPEKEALRAKWLAAGGRQTQRLFVGKTRGKSSAVILADAQGRPRIMMVVTPEGQPSLQFLDGQGKVVQQLPEAAKP